MTKGKNKQEIEQSKKTAVIEGTEGEIKTKNTAGFKIYQIFKTIFVYLFAIAIVVAAILFAVSNSSQKSIFGYRYYTVLTPSMEPTYSVGDVVIVRVCDSDSINVGDVITFNPSSDRSAYLTHRVTEKIDNYEGTGVTCFKTRGDANNADDTFLIDSSRVIGQATYSIPKVGYAIRFVQLRWYLIIPLVIMVFIFFRLIRVYFEIGSEATESKEEVSPEN